MILSAVFLCISCEAKKPPVDIGSLYGNWTVTGYYAYPDTRVWALTPDEVKKHWVGKVLSVTREGLRFPCSDLPHCNASFRPSADGPVKIPLDNFCPLSESKLEEVKPPAPHIREALPDYLKNVHYRQIDMPGCFKHTNLEIFYEFQTSPKSTLMVGTGGMLVRLEKK
ncbi:MAG: hypothetical protein K8S54_10560 [Spirochaetia bacterium]|nr:hypothetical protein [Spirochaetia bacterium]